MNIRDKHYLTEKLCVSPKAPGDVELYGLFRIK